MKKSTQNKIRKMTKESILTAQKTARTAAVDAFALGRGIVRGVRQGIDDIKKMDKRTKTQPKTKTQKKVKIQPKKKVQSKKK